MKISGARADDFQRCSVGICLRREIEWKLFPLFGDCCKRDDLPVVLPFTPDQRDAHLAGGSATKINPAGILLAFDKGKTRLPNSVRRRGVELNPRALAADKRLILVHPDNVVGSHRTPFAELHVAQRAALLRGWNIRFPR